MPATRAWNSVAAATTPLCPDSVGGRQTAAKPPGLLPAMKPPVVVARRDQAGQGALPSSLLGMETWDAIRARRNVRSFEERPIPSEELDRILEAGWRSPSASNRQ